MRHIPSLIQQGADMSIPRSPGRLAQLSFGASRSTLTVDKVLPACPKQSGLATTTILVGPKKRRFKVNCQLLCEISPFFRERLEDPIHAETISLWLPSESAAMFALFVQWVHAPQQFSNYMVRSVEMAHQSTDPAAQQELHWAIIHLHLFAADLSLTSLKDMAMDAIQEFYSRCQLQVTPQLVTYLYTECEADPSSQLRRWATATVAMIKPLPAGFPKLQRSHPEFGAAFKAMLGDGEEPGELQHLQLHSGEFRPCAFHSHSAVEVCNKFPLSPSTKAPSVRSTRSKWSVNRNYVPKATSTIEKKKPSFAQALAKTFRIRSS